MSITLNYNYHKQPQKTALTAVNKVNKHNVINNHNKPVTGKTEKSWN